MDPLYFDFTSLHKQLQQLMKEELVTLRAVFDMMKEEEMHASCSFYDQKKAFKEKKTAMNKRLKALQKQRLFLTKSLGQSSLTEKKTMHFNSPIFNKLIEKDEENALETFHLRDQILHFMKCIKDHKQRLLQRKPSGELFAAPEKMQKEKKPRPQSQQTQTLSLDSSTDGL